MDSALLVHIPAISAPLSEASASLRRFDVGHILQGRVLAVQGSRVLIALLGEQITAESAIPLQVGQALGLIVREVRSDRMILHIAQEANVETPGLQAPTEQDLSELLVAQHVPVDPTNVLIARALIRNALPITKAIVLTARHTLSFIDVPTAEDADAAIFLMVRELPVTPQSLELTKGALSQPHSLGAHVRALAIQLVELLSHIARDGTASLLPQPLFALAQQVLQDLPLLVLEHAQDRALAALIRQVLDQIATPTEARLARFLAETAFASSRREAHHPPAATANEIVIIEPLPLTSEGRPTFAPGDGHHAFQAPLSRPSQEPARDFRQQLALLRTMAVHVMAELPRHHSAAPLLHQLQTTIRELISMVETEQLTNAGMPPPTQAQGHYLFHLPVAVAGQNVTDTAEVRLYYQRRDHTKRVDPEKAHLAFLLQLSRLGSVELHVDLYRKHLRCRIECSRQEAADLFQQSSSELEERLQDIGYVVDAIRSVTTCSPEAHSEQPSTSGLFKIDLQA